MDEITLIVVDDHPVVRDGLQGMLSGQPDIDVVGEAVNGREAVEMALRLQPDVILMDLRMPEMDGVAAIEGILAEQPEANILVLTTYDSDEDIVRAMEAGATGYLLKDAPRQELFRAVRAAARGESVLAPTVAARLMDYMRSPNEETLSPREVAVLSLVAQGASNRQVGEELHISVATVKTHLVHIYEKLGVDNRTAAVTAALERRIIRLD